MLVPYNIGWHLAHHVDSGVPFRNLPKFHAALREAGYVDDTIEYASYPAIWKALRRRTAPQRHPTPSAPQPPAPDERTAPAGGCFQR